MDSGQSEDSCAVDTSQVDEYENRPFECEVCGNRFNRNAHLKVHLSVHTGERPHTCDVCGDRFKQSSALKTHMLRHTGDRPHVCKVCSKPFRTSSTLKKHSLIHTGEKPHSCQVCGKSFTQSGALKSHVFTHLPYDERPFRCNQCNQGFVNRSLFKVHGRHCGRERRKYSQHPPLDKRFFSGNGRNGYQCSFCKKPFPDKSRLRIHLRTHTGERPYKCELCERAFSQSGDLKIHLYTHTGERPHQCTMCDKGYTNKGTLNQHMRRHQKSMKTQSKSNNREQNKHLATPKVKLRVTTKAKDKNKINVHSKMKNYNMSVVSKFEDKNSPSPDSASSDCASSDYASSDCEVRHVEDSGAELQTDDECPEFVTEYIVSSDCEEEQNDPLGSDTGGLQMNSDSGSEKHLDNVELETEPEENELDNDNNLRQGTEMSENVLNSPSEINHNDKLRQMTRSVKTEGGLKSASRVNRGVNLIQSTEDTDNDSNSAEINIGDNMGQEN